MTPKNALYGAVSATFVFLLTLPLSVLAGALTGLCGFLEPYANRLCRSCYLGYCLVASAALAFLFPFQLTVRLARSWENECDALRDSFCTRAEWEQEVRRKTPLL